MILSLRVFVWYHSNQPSLFTISYSVTSNMALLIVIIVKYKGQALYIQLFRKRLSEKVHANLPKGIVGGFQCSVLQRNLKKWHGRPRTCVCECYKKATKICSAATVVRKSVLIISHITFRDCRVHIFSDNLSRNSCILS